MRATDRPGCRRSPWRAPRRWARGPSRRSGGAGCRSRPPPPGTGGARGGRSARISSPFLSHSLEVSRESVAGWGISGLSGLARLVAGTCKEESTRGVGGFDRMKNLDIQMEFGNILRFNPSWKQKEQNELTNNLNVKGIKQVSLQTCKCVEDRIVIERPIFFFKTYILSYLVPLSLGKCRETWNGHMCKRLKLDNYKYCCEISAINERMFDIFRAPLIHRIEKT
jgi:hypothetical protein